MCKKILFICAVCHVSKFYLRDNGRDQIEMTLIKLEFKLTQLKSQRPN